MSTVLTRVVIAAVIIFAGGCGGLYYIMTGDGAKVDENNKDLAWAQSNELQVNQRREFDEALNEIDLEDDWDVEEVDNQAFSLPIVSDLKQPLILQETPEEKERRLEREFGPKIEATSTITSDIPVPLDKNNQPIRKNQYPFEKVPRDSKFKEATIQSYSNDWIGKKYTQYLILADANHELWDIKFRQLSGYLEKTGSFASGSRNFGYLTSETTKDDLVRYCHRAYASNPAVTSVLGSTSLADFNAIWHWCTLPQYWGQPRPDGWQTY